MKLKNIVALFLALAVSVCCLGISAFATDIKFTSAEDFKSVGFDIRYTCNGSNFDYSKFVWGDLVNLNFKGSTFVGYAPHSAQTSSTGSQIIVESGMINHSLGIGDSLKMGNYVITCDYKSSDKATVLVNVYLNGNRIKSKPYYNQYPEESKKFKAFKLGFIPYTFGGKKFIAIVSCWNDVEGYKKKTQAGDIYNVIEIGFALNNDGTADIGSGMSFYTIDCEKAGEYSTDVVLPSDDSLSTAYMKGKLTCPDCHGHNISYRWSFLQSGVVGAVTWQVGYVFKCRDCGASWRALFDSDENEKFHDYIQTGDDDFTPDQIQEDSSLPPFTSSSDWGVTLPDDTDTTAYLNEVFSALNTYTGAFNNFFTQVFSILPAPVLAVILLGVGLVVIVGIIKAVVG